MEKVECRNLIDIYKKNEEFNLKARKITDINFFGLKHMNHTFG